MERDEKRGDRKPREELPEGSDEAVEPIEPDPLRGPGSELEWGRGAAGGYGRSGEYGERGGPGAWGPPSARNPPEPPTPDEAPAAERPKAESTKRRGRSRTSRTPPV